MPAEVPRPGDPVVYVSYAWGDESDERERIVDQLCEALQCHHGIVVRRDKRRQRIGDSIEDFAADVGRADVVLAVVSAKYLRSYHCMVQELLQLFTRCHYRRQEFRKRVCLLLLEDGSEDIDVSQPLIDHWREFCRDEKSRLEQLDPDRSGSRHSWDALDDIKMLQKRMKDMLSALADSVMPRGYEEICRDEFLEVRHLVLRRLQEWHQWRQGDSGGLIPTMEAGVSEGPSAEIQRERANDHFLALVLQWGEVLVDDPAWWRHERPWEFRSYRWESLLFTPQESGYQPVALGADLGSRVVATAGLGAAVSGLEKPSTIQELLQAAVQWMDRQEEPCSLELFVPTELLLLDWSMVLVSGKSEYDEDEHLFERHPYVLRSVDRFRDERLASQRKQLLLKYSQLAAGAGKWIACPVASDFTKLKERGLIPEHVGLKHMAPLHSDPSSRLQWHRRVVEAMVPLAVWWRDREPLAETDRRSHLDAGYGALLAGHQDGDPVPRDCRHLEKLPQRRHTLISQPPTKGLVLLLDHPERHPWSRSKDRVTRSA